MFEQPRYKRPFFNKKSRVKSKLRTIAIEKFVKLLYLDDNYD